MRGRRAGKGRDSNLFKIDFDQIERLLGDANSDLSRKVDNILSRADDLPIVIENKADAEKSQKLIQEIETLIQEVSQARLADGRPFTEAAKVVKKWFSRSENNLKKKEAFLSDRLAEFAIQIQTNRNTPEIENIGAKSAIELSVDREPTVTLEEESHQVLHEAPLDVALQWEVKSFNRAFIPIEDLRDYFSDSSINVALKKHLIDNGPNQLEGVEYVQRLVKP
jgi:hypothetical protein